MASIPLIFKKFFFCKICFSFFRTISFGTTVDDQQLGVVWLRDRIVSCSLSGFLNYVDPEALTITKILKGHNKSITAMALASDGENVFTADFEGNISKFFFRDNF